MGKNNDIPLHQRVHFRRTRDIITEIAEFEGINITNYDLFNMRIYEVSGDSLNGNNVKYNTNTRNSIFVTDNHYDMFEIPKKTNVKGSLYGEYIFFIHNTSFDYYMLGTLIVSLNRSETISRRIPIEFYEYNNFGKYFIIYENNENNITKVIKGTEFNPGLRPAEINHPADSYNCRKHAYGSSNHKILRDLGVNITSTKEIKGKTRVEVYRKKPDNTTSYKQIPSSKKKKRK